MLYLVAYKIICFGWNIKTIFAKHFMGIYKYYDYCTIFNIVYETFDE